MRNLDANWAFDWLRLKQAQWLERIADNGLRFDSQPVFKKIGIDGTVVDLELHVTLIKVGQAWMRSMKSLL